MLVIEDLLGADDLDRIAAELATGVFRDGRATAGAAARRVKNNEQLDPDCPAYTAVTAIITERLWAASTFQAAVLPKIISRLIVSRYGPKMSFGPHYDNAIMTGAATLRSDLAFTVFLNDAASYEGGSLVIETKAGEDEIKLPAGAAVIYPATSIHRVEPVRSGIRLVAVGWVQSLCRLADHRDILFQLYGVNASLRQRGEERIACVTGNVHANLLRLWADL
jgi:PKHD-type hydroxylase